MEIENKELQSEYETTQIQAGVKELSQFGNFSTIDSLADGNVLNYDAVTNLPYIVIFTKLRYEKIKNNYYKKLQKILNKQFK